MSTWEISKEMLLYTTNRLKKKEGAVMVKEEKGNGVEGAH